MKRALISVSDKTGLVDFAKALHAKKIEILSTGGTASFLKENNIPVVEISDYTGYPELMEGRLKTLHPKVHGGILGRRDIDAQIMESHEIANIDLVVVNLYPFEATISRDNCTFSEAIENIDIGGPTLLRAAAKNHKWVTVIVDPVDYKSVIENLDINFDHTSESLRFRLAAKVFAHTAAYESLIANYFATIEPKDDESHFPKTLNLQFSLEKTLRYGENPHQKAALYIEKNVPSNTVAGAKLLQGKPLSFNNLNDAESALECVKQLRQPACVIVKHANPCGAAIDESLLKAYQKAYACDPESSFGGIIAFNRIVDDLTLSAILDNQFVEVIIAPQFSPAATLLAQTKINLRLLETGYETKNNFESYDIKRIHGGILVQDFDSSLLTLEDLSYVSETQPSSNQIQDLIFAMNVATYVKSNAIVIASKGQTIGIGAGQMSRVFALKIAQTRAQSANYNLKNAVLASDAFFPFRDSIDLAAAMGIGAIIQPAGSKRDLEVIQAANEHSIALVFTAKRHFKH